MIEQTPNPNWILVPGAAVASVFSPPFLILQLAFNPVSNGAKTVPHHLSGLGMDTLYRIWPAMSDTPATAIAIFAGERGDSILVFIEA